MSKENILKDPHKVQYLELIEKRGSEVEMRGRIKGVMGH